MGNILKGPRWCIACLANHAGRSCKEYREYILRLKTSLGKSHSAPAKSLSMSENAAYPKLRPVNKHVRLPADGDGLGIVVEPSGVRLTFHSSSGRECSISLHNFINSGAFNGDVIKTIEEWTDDRIRNAHAQKD